MTLDSKASASVLKLFTLLCLVLLTALVFFSKMAYAADGVDADGGLIGGSSTSLGQNSADIQNLQSTSSGATFQDINSNSVWIKQAVTGSNGTCTLASATMMLRRAAMMNGDANWNSITESAVRAKAWAPGLRWDFWYSNIPVQKGDLPGGSSNTSRLINILKNHQEGVVGFDTSVGHAVLITDYTNGTFYCCDPLYAKKTPISQAWKVTIKGMTKYWYVSSYVKPLIDDDTVKSPSISAKRDITGGATVTITNNHSGSTVFYNAGGGQQSFTGNSKSVTLTSANTTISAYAKKGSSSSSTVGPYRYTLSTTATPTLEKTDTAGGATISLDSSGNGETIFYTLDGSEPAFNVATGQGTGTKYTAAFTLTENATVKAIAVRSGELASGKLVQEVKVVPPEIPTGLSTLVGSKPSDKLAVDDAIAKSVQFITYVRSSIGAGALPEIVPDWVEQVNQEIEDIEKILISEKMKKSAGERF